MINYSPILVEELEKILPTEYELFLDNDTQLPCISYIQTNDVSRADGDTIRFSEPTFQIKIWCRTKDELAHYSSLLDDSMYNQRFKRIGYNEMTHDNILCGIFRYQALAVEIR